MKAMVPQDEQETTINVFPKVVTDRAEVYTCIQPTINRLKKLSAQHPGKVEIRELKPYGVIASVPCEWIKITPKRNVKPRKLTDEERRIATERLAKAREEQRRRKEAEST